MSELKRFGTGVEAKEISDTAEVKDLLEIAQGANDTQREGNSIYLSSIRGTAYFVVADTTDIYRLVLFQWHAVGVPTAAQILENDIGGDISVFSAFNHEYRRQYTILYDKSVLMIGNGASSSIPYTTATAKFYHINIKMKRVRRKIQYVGSASNSGASNSIFYLVISNSAAAPNPFMTLNLQVKYRDM